jgi:universal stress protein E
MDALRNILVLMEPHAETQPAFDAALELARRHEARLELLVVDYQDLHAAYFTPPTATLQEFHDSVMAGHQAVLERHVQRAAAQGVVALAEALWGTPFHEVVLARVAATHPDLVVKHSVYHNPIERTLFTGSDWHLIRDCPSPLLLVKDAARLAGRPVLVCVDPLHSHDKPAALDHQLMARAVTLAGRLDGELHALHVFSVPAPVTVVGDAYIAAAALPAVDQTPSQADTAFRDLLSAHGVPAAHAHLRVGAPVRDIVAQARALDAGLVVMGAVSRRRLERWFVGSTAESVLDRLPCNVWIEKPAPG